MKRKEFLKVIGVSAAAVPLGGVALVKAATPDSAPSIDAPNVEPVEPSGYRIATGHSTVFGLAGLSAEDYRLAREADKRMVEDVTLAYCNKA